MRPVRKDSASGRSKCAQVVLTGPCLRPVMDHRTRPVPIPEDLDLSGVDRTLGGSVRSLPPERPVSGSRASSGLFSVSFSITFGGLLNRTTEFFLDPVATLPSALARAAASTARRRSLACHRAPGSPRRPTAPEPPRALPRQLGPHLPCPRSPGLLASRAPPGLAAPPCLPERPCLRSSRVIKFHRALVLPPSSLAV